MTTNQRENSAETIRLCMIRLNNGDPMPSELVSDIKKELAQLEDSIGAFYVHYLMEEIIEEISKTWGFNFYNFKKAGFLNF
tara:strand:+ start:1398 stop:1640 length:243 start_codon:yes stop_codon:yes gene_type:complete